MICALCATSIFQPGNPEDELQVDIPTKKKRQVALSFFLLL